MMQVKREIVIVPAVTFVLITPVTLKGDEEKETAKNNSMEECTL
jgi:hypothetical protein